MAHIVTSLGRKIYVPSAEEEAAINAGIAADPDAQPFTDAEWALAKVMRGRPTVEHPKKVISMRLDDDVVAALRASGKGWQTRVNQLLREYVSQ
jgi:uncharacterized protein (DUF4415 family)